MSLALTQTGYPDMTACVKAMTQASDMQEAPTDPHPQIGLWNSFWEKYLHGEYKLLDNDVMRAFIQSLFQAYQDLDWVERASDDNKSWDQKQEYEDL